MGTWSTTLFGDDTAQEIYHHYRRLHAQDPATARAELERAWADALTDTDEGPIFWFALARAQWEFGALDDAVLSRVAEIAEQGLGLDRWREAGPKTLAKREEAVRAFLAHLREPNPKPKKAKAPTRYPPVYQAGDCLAIRLSDGALGAALVLATDDKHETEGVDFVGMLEWHAAEPPQLEVFSERRWIRPDPIGPLIPVQRMCLARTYWREKGNVEKIGETPRRKNDPKYTGTGFMGGWSDLRGDLELYYGTGQ